MKTQTHVIVLVSVLSLMSAQGAQAKEKAEQLQRDSARLAEIKSIALMPDVIQVRFDQDRRIPDPNRMTARLGVAQRIPTILEQAMKSSKYELLSTDGARMAVREMKQEPIDLYLSQNIGTWNAPAETLRNNKGDTALLLNTRDTMKQTPDETTAFRYQWHDMPDTVFGLAAFKLNATAKPDADKAKAVGEKLGADAVLYLQVGDMEVHEGTTLIQEFRSVRIHLYATLISARDGAVIWQARARGIRNSKEGVVLGKRSWQPEALAAIPSATEAVNVLLDDLERGVGKPALAKK